MFLFYVAGFIVDNSGGKSRATLQKSLALKKHCERFYFSRIESRYLYILNLIFQEFKVSFYLVAKRPDVIITRGFNGYFYFFICKMLKITYVREVHSDNIEESFILNKPTYQKTLFRLFSKFMLRLEKNSDILIFNHPSLLEHYKDFYAFNGQCFYSYNGYGIVKDTFEVNKLKHKYNLKDGFFYLCFTGSASPWHGVDYLVDLQNYFDENKLNVKIICAGGEIDSTLLFNSSVINIFPLSSNGCLEVISLSDICLLPVKNNRVSPGSPLKLYDYILKKKFVVTQENVIGYSDEVKKYTKGIMVDFSDVKSSGESIYNVLLNKQYLNDVSDSISDFSWDSRMFFWVKKIKQLRSIK